MSINTKMNQNSKDEEEREVFNRLKKLPFFQKEHMKKTLESLSKLTEEQLERQYPIPTEEFLDKLYLSNLILIRGDAVIGGLYTEEELKLIDRVIDKKEEGAFWSWKSSYKIHRDYYLRDMIACPERYKICTNIREEAGSCGCFNERENEECWKCSENKFRELLEEDERRLEELMERIEKEKKEKKQEYWKSYYRIHSDYNPKNMIAYPEQYKICISLWEGGGICERFNERDNEECWICSGRRFRELNEKDNEKLSKLIQTLEEVMKEKE